MAEGGSFNKTTVPIGFWNYCQAHKSDCRPDRFNTALYSPTLMLTLRLVNSSVNRQIKPRADEVESWNVEPEYGDCDDYLMTKRARLIKIGVPRSALRIAVVQTSWGEMHGVLIVHTNRDDYVLDNLEARVLPLKRMNHRLIKMSSADPLTWYSAETPNSQIPISGK